MCRIDPTKVEALATELKSHCSEKHVLEIYSFTITLHVPAGDKRKKVDVQVVAMEDGTLKVIRVKKNESRAAVIDVVYMHRCVVVRVYVCVYVCVYACVCVCECMCV